MREGALLLSPKRSALTLVSLLASASGATRLLHQRRRWRADPRVFILEYHDVGGDGSEREGVISATRFRQHLRFLKRRFRFESLSRAVELLQEPGALRVDCIVLTFDDGYLGNFQWAWPVLRDEGVPATIFLTTGFLDGEELWFDAARRDLEAARRLRPGLPAETVDLLVRTLGRWPPSNGLDTGIDRLKYLRPGLRDAVLRTLRGLPVERRPAAVPLSWANVRELLRAGIEIGCHTVSHPILSQLPADLQEREILRSRERVAEETGFVPSLFAFPNGSARDFNAITIEIARRVGFKAACTTIRGSNRPGCDVLRLYRIGVGNDSTAVLAARLAGLFDEGVRKWIVGHRILTTE